MKRATSRVAAAFVNAVLDAVRGYTAARDFFAARKPAPFR